MMTGPDVYLDPTHVVVAETVHALITEPGFAATMAELRRTV